MENLERAQGDERNSVRRTALVEPKSVCKVAVAAPDQGRALPEDQKKGIL